MSGKIIDSIKSLVSEPAFVGLVITILVTALIILLASEPCRR